MSAFPWDLGGGSGPEADGPEPTSLTETAQLPDRELARARWSRRSAQWRALDLARHVFGEASAHLSGPDGGPRTRPGPAPFRGLLRLRVPFDDLEAHREREALFRACAGLDPVLQAVQLLYVFVPDADAVPRPVPAPVTEGVER